MLRKGCTIILLIPTVLVVPSATLFYFSFRPIKSSITIELENGMFLLCEESLESDFHRAIYNVDFTLKEKDRSTYFGWGEFISEDWQEKIVFHQIEDWSVLAVKDWGNLKILVADPSKEIRKDTVFLPSDLRYDGFWNSRHRGIPAEYYGASRLDSISKESFFISYEYRIGNYQPFEFYFQTVEYTFKPETGDFETDEVFNRVFQ